MIDFNKPLECDPGPVVPIVNRSTSDDVAVVTFEGVTYPVNRATGIPLSKHISAKLTVRNVVSLEDVLQGEWTALNDHAISHPDVLYWNELAGVAPNIAKVFQDAIALADNQKT